MPNNLTSRPSTRARRNTCEECGERPGVERFRGQILCAECLCPTVPARIEDHMHLRSSWCVYDTAPNYRGAGGLGALLTQRMAERGIPNGPTPRDLATVARDRAIARRRQRASSLAAADA